MSSSTSALTPDRTRGFLPSHDPLTRLPQPFDAWESTASGLPKLLASDHIRRTIEDLPPFPLDQISGTRERDEGTPGATVRRFDTGR